MNSFEETRQRFPIGTRVRFKFDEERYPHFTVPEGTTGIVTESNETAHYVRVDSFVEGLSDSLEWWGEFAFTPEDAADGPDGVPVPYEPTDAPTPASQVVAVIPKHHASSLTVRELREVLANFDGDAEVTLLAVIDGKPTANVDVQGVRNITGARGAHGKGLLELVGFDTDFNPADLYEVP